MLRVFTVVVLIGVLAQGLTHILAQVPEGEVRFAETDVVVGGPFLEYFGSHGGLERFGYPLSGELTLGDQIIQVFEYGALVRPVSDTAQVAVLPIGERLGHREAGFPVAPYSFSHVFYSQTGHSVAFAFRTYFESQGGADNFGYPISEPLLENGRIVQYFQGARLEWDGQQVRLGRLGPEYLAALGATD